MLYIQIANLNALKFFNLKKSLMAGHHLSHLWF
jgi:hypothetical protein